MKYGDILWISKICIGGLMIFGLIGGDLYAGSGGGDPGRIPGEYLERVVNAIYIAEGGKRAKKPFGVLSVPCVGHEACRRVCRNTVRNSWRRWRKAGLPEDFVSKSRSGNEAVRGRTINGIYYEDFLSFLGSRYAPLCYNKVGCNDKNNLNKNWVKNVRYHLEKMYGVQKKVSSKKK